MTRKYPISKLLRFSKALDKAIQAQADAEDLSYTAYVREALARDLVLRKSR